MALTTGMAILGSAAIGAAAGGISSSNAANKAANASQQATDANAALQREALATQQANTAVARGAGDASINQLMQRLGISQSGQSATSPTAAPTSSQPAAQPQQPNTTVTDPTKTFNAASYLAANPDVAAAVNDPNSQFAGATAAERAADHYARYGQAEVASGGRSLGSERQEMPGGQPTYTAPTYIRPEFDQTLDVSMERFKGSPEYQVAQYDIAKQGGQVQASLAAQGLLNSGAALRRLQEVGQDNSVKYYGDFRDYNTGQFNTDRSRFDNNYNFDTSLASNNALAYANLGQNAYQYGQSRADNNYNIDRAYGTDLALNNRQYETGRYDNQTNALFNLANLGQGAASNYGAAVQNSANNQGNALFSNAANQGNAALTSANNLNSLIGQGTNALAYYYGNKG